MGHGNDTLIQAKAARHAAHIAQVEANLAANGIETLDDLFALFDGEVA